MEATIVCIDNSEWSRSGDFTPTRFQAQADAVNLLTGAKTQAHPENTVGVLTMAGKTPRVLVTPTPELGKVLNSMTEIIVEGESNICASLQISQLALKHRQNKNQRQRIVVFIGSPVTEDKEKLVQIAKKLKKNSVAVDIVSFGCDDDENNTEKLDAFFQAVNSNGNSHLVTVPPGLVMSDVLINSPIFQGEGGSGYGFGGGPAIAPGAEGFEFGVDPNIDPDLALALRVSLEEERARQNAAAGGAEGGADASGVAATPGAAAAPGAGDMDLDEDALLQQALAMSIAVDGTEAATPAATPAAAAAAPGTAPGAPAPAPAPAADDMDGIEDEELRMALALSMEENEPSEIEEKKDAA
eukprot:gene15628-21733_t